jgi:hypothetical protein
MSYSDKHKGNSAQCANTRCRENASTLRVFHGQVNWYCGFHSAQIDEFQGKTHT